MKTNAHSSETASSNALARWGRFTLLFVCALLVLNGVALFFFVAENAQVQTSAILLTGLGAMGFLVVLDGLRAGFPWAVRSLWVLAAVLALVGLHIWTVGRADVGLWYLGLATATIVGLLLVARGTGSTGRRRYEQESERADQQ